MLKVPLEPTESSPSPFSAYSEMMDALLAGEDCSCIPEIASRYVGQPVEVVLPNPAIEPEPGSIEEFVLDWVASGHAVKPPGVTNAVPIASGFERYGLVVMTTLAPGIDQAELDEFLKAAAVAALTGIAIQRARDDAEYLLSGSFLEEILSRKDLEPKDVLRRADHLGCNLREGAVGLCAQPLDGDPETLLRRVFSIRSGILGRVFEGKVYALLPGGVEDAEAMARQIGKFAGTGISSHYAKPTDARHALEEAELMLEVSAAGGSASQDDAGSDTFRLLFRVLATHPEEMKRFSDGTIGPIVKHDEQYSTDLVPTLRAYLHEYDCNMNLTAKAIFAHRHTVSNRLAKVRELTGLDPFRSEDRERLGLALKALQITEHRPQR